MKNTLYIIFIITLLFTFQTKAEVLKKLEIKGNSRISEETLKVYGEIQINKDYTTDDINEIIKKLSDTKFFSKILSITAVFLKSILSYLLSEIILSECMISFVEYLFALKKKPLDSMSDKELS